MAIRLRPTGSPKRAATVPSANSRPNNQLMPTPKPRSPPAEVICTPVAQQRRPVGGGRVRAELGDQFLIAAARSQDHHGRQPAHPEHDQPGCGPKDDRTASLAGLDRGRDPESVHAALLGRCVHQREERPFDVDAVRIQGADQAPVGQHTDPVGDPGHLVQVVAGHQNAGPSCGPSQQGLAQRDDPGRVEGIGRLVEHDEVGTVLQGRRQPESLLVAQRHPARPNVGVPAQIELVQDSFDRWWGCRPSARERSRAARDRLVRPSRSP